MLQSVEGASGIKLPRYRLLLTLLVLSGALIPASLMLIARVANGRYGFPLDDPWIHLTYARNLLTHHVLTYFPGSPSSGGSTAPLYTLILAPVLALVRDEKLASYGVGLVAHAGFLWVMSRYALLRLGATLWAAVCVLLLVLDGRLALLAVSGMETSLFLLVVSIALLARCLERDKLLGAALGLALWLRPDALILVAVTGIDLVIKYRWCRDSTRSMRRLRQIGLGALFAVGLAAGYFAFNHWVGGTWFPNTLAAKRAYYAGVPVRRFLSADIAPLLLSDGWYVLMPWALGAMGMIAWTLIRRRRPACLLEAGWLVALPLAYAVMLPYSHRFQRYLVPILPALAMVSVDGARHAWTAIGQWRRELAWGGRLVIALLIGAAVVLQAAHLSAWQREFTYFCDYHYLRHERTGRWIADHTPKNAVIATHDVGAVAFYSQRKVVDIVGLVQPDVIPYLRQPRYLEYLEALFQREEVTHVALLQSWFEADNIQPLFIADPQPEVMEVVPWVPGRTILMFPYVGELRSRALRALERGRWRDARAWAARALAEAPRSARGWAVSAVVAERLGQWHDAKRAYRQALQLAPDLEFASERLRELEHHRRLP